MLWYGVTKVSADRRGKERSRLLRQIHNDTTSSKLPMFNDTVTGFVDPEFQISKKYPTIGDITGNANLTVDVTSINYS